jgi:hypothetical protein
LSGLAAALAVTAVAGSALVLWCWSKGEVSRTEPIVLRTVETDPDELKQGGIQKQAIEHHLPLLDAQRRLYAQQISLAWQAWQGGHLRLLREVLDGCPTQQRGWEWGYLSRLGQGDLHTLPVSPAVRQVAFHPDRRQLALATAEQERAVLLVDPWDDQIRKISLSEGTAQGIAFSRDGKHLAISVTLSGVPEHSSGVVRVYSASTTKPEITLGQGQAANGALAFSPDGQWLACAGLDRVIRIHEVASGRLVRQLPGHTRALYHFCFHPEGVESQRLACGGFVRGGCRRRSDRLQSRWSIAGCGGLPAPRHVEGSSHGPAPLFHAGTHSRDYLVGLPPRWWFACLSRS